MLIQHMQEALAAEDSGEAIHFATMLLHFGYLFPVIDVQAQLVKVWDLADFYINFCVFKGGQHTL